MTAVLFAIGHSGL